MKEEVATKVYVIMKGEEVMDDEGYGFKTVFSLMGEEGAFLDQAEAHTRTKDLRLEERQAFGYTISIYSLVELELKKGQ